MSSSKGEHFDTIFCSACPQGERSVMCEGMKDICQAWAVWIIAPLLVRYLINHFFFAF